MKHLTIGLVALALASWMATGAWAFESTGDCVGCHNTFGGPGDPTHDLHNTFINGCRYCHTSNGDTPLTGSSGEDPNNSCSGCHTAGGTAQHHITTEASGCGCHSDPGMYPRGTEATEPPYYDTAATSLRFSCFDGIDNDGDDLYDGSDSDCNGVPSEERSWSVIKEYYGSE